MSALKNYHILEKLNAISDHQSLAHILKKKVILKIYIVLTKCQNVYCLKNIL